MLQVPMNRASYVVLTILSLTALLLVLWGYTQPPNADEGTPAHLFQLSVVLGATAGFICLATADWTQPWNVVKTLAVPVVAFLLSFAALYYMENHYMPAHYPPAVRTDR